MSSYNLTHLKELESEAIFILREVAAQFEKPVMLFSGGKDSIIMFHLARKAFHPGKVPFPLMHVDTGHNFPETIEFRDRLMVETGETLIVKYVQDSIDNGTAVEETGINASRNGEIKDFTGISAPFEVPENPEIEINTSELSIDESVQKVLDYVLPIIKNK